MIGGLVCECVQVYQGESLTKYDPFGREPAFNPLKAQFVPYLIGQEGEFYNISEGSGEVAATGLPFAFFPQRVKGLPLGFPVYFNVRYLPPYRSYSFSCSKHTIASVLISFMYEF